MLIVLKRFEANAENFGYTVVTLEHLIHQRFDDDEKLVYSLESDDAQHVAALVAKLGYKIVFLTPGSTVDANETSTVASYVEHASVEPMAQQHQEIEALDESFRVLEAQELPDSKNDYQLFGATNGGGDNEQ